MSLCPAVVFRIIREHNTSRCTCDETKSAMISVGMKSAFHASRVKSESREFDGAWFSAVLSGISDCGSCIRARDLVRGGFGRSNPRSNLPRGVVGGT
jgi:hypothetical protein